MRLIFYSFCIFIYFGGNNLFSQKLSFYKEDLKFYLDTNNFIVDGYYYLSNNDSSKVSQIIFYPFPTEADFGNVDSISVFDDTFKKEISFYKAKDNSGITFLLQMEGYGFRKIKIIYRQRLNNNIAKYILRTTQNWGKPIESANYILSVSDKIKIDSLSYPADSARVVNNKTIYYWSKKNFFPREDFIFYFSH